MHFLQYATALLSTSVIATSAFTIPQDLDASSLSIRDGALASDVDHSPLEKRRGGGGGRGGGSSGSGGTTGSGGSGRTGTGSTGGTTGSTGGSARGSPSYGGRYAGGASTPFRAGAPLGGRAVPLLIGGGLGFWAASSLGGWGRYGAYEYEYPADITFYNETSMMNETLPGVCLCSRYQACSCSAQTPSGDTVDALVGNGSYAYQRANADLFQVATINGTRTLAVNGTLANSTTDTNAAGLSGNSLMENAGWLGLVAVIGSVVCLL